MNNISIDKKRLCIRLDGAIPTRDILSSLDEIVEAAIAAPSNYKNSKTKGKKILLTALANSGSVKNLSR